jgi:hypothetical protein
MSASENYDDDYDLDDDGSTAVKELRRANKAKEKELRALQEQLASLTKQSRDRAVKDVLTSRGLNAKIAAFIPADIDPSEEAVASWVEQYADVFGASTQQAAPAVDAEALANLSAMGQISQVQQTAAPFSGDATQVGSLIAGAQSPEDLNRILFGNPSGPNAF